MRVSIPASVTEQIANRATQIARANAVARGWKSSQSLNPVAGAGYAGVKSSKKYYMFQELGTKPYLMRSLEGKTIPIRDESGLHFIKVVGVGQPGWVTLPGGIRKWRDQKWRHPGLKPTNLMGDATKQAVGESRGLIEDLMKKLIGLEQ